ncbi:DUF2829 domain-containing protein [Klebsiella pneumoniae]|uniref:DUF2829 domain-containing protein n=1 Tax=Klebsiella pneumoniae TaxID=573 RepID=UPI000E2D206F|nr:DUF2829 domain-containing protein [Klebsiella pneumoniae]SXH71289.1 Protein of uncharacterised function (DUF2829) [Klebsiella pneumoniae]HEE4911119.1 DUF2829 domain-containing protein [Klebsiella pneumoniae]
MDLSNKQALKLPKYQSIKIVEAAEIFKIEKKTLIVSFRRHVAKIKVDQPYLDKHKPEVGGYFVRYEDGYESYSPKEPFESGYLSVEATVYAAKVGTSFGIAIEMLKDGYRVARKGWKGKGMWLRYIDPYAPHPDDSPEASPRNPYFKAWDNNSEAEGTMLPWIGMKTADNKFVPWLASQTDMLAEDWVIAEVAA